MRAESTHRPKPFFGLICLGLGLCAGFLLGGGADSYGQERGGKPQTNEKKPLRVTSDKMEVMSRKNLIVFIGDVKANQGDLRIQANRLEVYTRRKERSDPKRKSTPSERAGEIDKIVAIGNVLMDQAKRRFATADRLEYLESTGVAVLTGSPRAWEGKNQVVGTRIELNLREDKTTVHGSPRQRVDVTLFPSGETPRPKKSN